MPYDDADVSSESTLKITAKGQVTLKRDLLKHLGIGPGQRVKVTAREDGVLELRAVKQASSWADLVGIAYGEGQPSLTIEEINEATADGWAGIGR